MTTARVFIPQIVEKYSEEMGRSVSVFNFRSAMQFGTLTPILERGDNPLFIVTLQEKIRAALKEFGPNDYLIAVGDPSVIAVCCAAIAKSGAKTMKLLKWDRIDKQYLPVEIEL